MACQDPLELKVSPVFPGLLESRADPEDREWTVCLDSPDCLDRRVTLVLEFPVPRDPQAIPEVKEQRVPKVIPVSLATPAAPDVAASMEYPELKVTLVPLVNLELEARQGPPPMGLRVPKDPLGPLD